MSSERRLTSYVFTGQEAAKSGMATDILKYPQAQEVFERASEATTYDLIALCTEAPDEQIQKTSLAQPAVVTTAIAHLEVLKAETDIQPVVVAGHSLGEYPALYTAGSLKLEDTVHLVANRGKFMEEEAEKNPGSMAALLKINFARAKELCAKTGAEVANVNSEQQIVIAGTTDAVSDACDLAKELGGRVREMPFKVASHCSWAHPVAIKMGILLESTVFEDPKCLFFSNATGNITITGDSARRHLKSQLTNTVLWKQIFDNIVKDPVRDFIEVGAPGALSKGLIQRNAADAGVEVRSQNSSEII